MRILLVHPGAPLSQHDVWRGWNKALRKIGHEVTGYRLDQHLLKFGKWPPSEAAEVSAQEGVKEAAQDLNPDLVFFIDGDHMIPEVLRLLNDYGHRSAMLHTESPYADDNQLRLAPYLIANFLNDPTNLAKFEQHGPAAYVPHSFDPEIHYPSDEPKDIGFLFIGTALPSRVEFFTAMNLDGVDACIDGGGWPGSPNGVLNEDAATLYRRGQLGINYYRREGDTSVGWSMGPREVEMAACGLPFLRDPRPEGDEVFPFLPVYHNPEEASDLVRRWLGDGKLRERAASQVLEAVQGRTFEVQATRVMKMIEEIL